MKKSVIAFITLVLATVTTLVASALLRDSDASAQLSSFALTVLIPATVAAFPWTTDGPRSATPGEDPVRDTNPLIIHVAKTLLRKAFRRKE